jgi:UDP-2-acetamido-3-amino-2,3-dideoxy-glucuronate N-acetyltransferase
MEALKKNIAIVGLGYWGKNLVRNFAEIGVLYGLCDTDEVRLDKFSRDCNVVFSTTDYNLLLQDSKIDAVVIATPAMTHYKLVKQAIEAGKDVFVEKPLALNVDEAEELQELALKHERILMVDHILQFHPAIEKIKALIADGTLGDLRYIYSNRLNIGLLRKEENILWSFAPHDISVILALTGKDPVGVRSFGEAYIQPDVFDTTVMNLTFTDKLKAHIFVSWLHPFKEQKLVVIGSKCMAVFNDVEKENKLMLYPHKVSVVDDIPVADKAQGEGVAISSKEPLREACLHFIQSITDRTQPLTDGVEAIKVLKVINQAQESLDKGMANV